MRLRYLLLSLTAAALVPLLTGCGGDSEEAVAQTTIPPAKFDHQADLICEEAGNEQLSRATAYLQQHPKAKEVDLVVPAAISPIEKEINELRELGLPTGQEEKAKAVVDEMEAALLALKDEPSSALSQKDNPFKHSNELAEQLGLGDCARNP